MTAYQWHVRSHAPARPGEKCWRLDSAEMLAGASSLRLRGWAVPLDGKRATVIVRSSGTTYRQSLNDWRPDVLRRVMAIDPEKHKDEVCGFNFALDEVGSSVEIGVEYGDTVFWAWDVVRTVPAKVLLGLAGWLYLDNDSNRSVEQYTGHLLLTNDQIAAWNSYFGEVHALAQATSFTWALLVAPAKEYVYPEFYAHAAGARNCMTQMLEEVQHGGRICWPLAELRESKELTYWKGDTHWTDFGAGLAARISLERLGENVQGHDVGVRYRAVTRAGDLGGKFTPRRTFTVMDAEFPTDGESELIFDNGIRNHGCLRIYECINAASRETCIVFGDSFSVNMIPWLARRFTRLVYAHTAGAIDRALIERERPQVVLLQTNSRFVVTPLRIGRPLEQAVRSKLSKMEAPELAELVRNLANQTSASGKRYQDWMAGLIAGSASDDKES